MFWRCRHDALGVDWYPYKLDQPTLQQIKLGTGHGADRGRGKPRRRAAELGGRGECEASQEDEATQEDELRSWEVVANIKSSCRIIVKFKGGMNLVTRLSRLKPHPDDPPRISPRTTKQFYRYSPNHATNTYSYTPKGSTQTYTH